MNIVVMKISKKHLERVAIDYKLYLKDFASPFINFIANKNNTTITCYHSGKIVFQGPTAMKEALKYSSIGLIISKKDFKDLDSYKLPNNFSEKCIIGSDEVGNGSYFGPLVVCAVYVRRSDFKCLKHFHITDSKMMKDKKIVEIAESIKKIVSYKLLVISPKKYNQVQLKYNAVQMKVALHNQAIRLLLKKIKPEKPEAILIDQFTSPKNYYKYLSKEKEKITKKLYFMTSGEKHHLSVAIASILSREKFLKELEKMSEKLNTTVPSGANIKSDMLAAQIIKKSGMKELSHYVKIHFANTQKAKEIAKN